MRGLHLEGMGMLGSALAWELAHAGVEFTWSDTEESVAAWPASSGGIFPTGEQLDLRCWRAWYQWRQRPEYRGIVEEARMWYSTKAPPHGAKFKAEREEGALKLAPYTHNSLYLNVSGFVRRTRETFAERRTDGPAEGDRVIQAHGFGPGREAYLWGWTAEVRVWVDVPATEDGLRPAFYLRRGKYQLAYLNPLPGGGHLLGTSMIRQTVPKQLEIAPKVEKAAALVEALSGGAVRVRDILDIREGWRPIGPETVVRTEGGLRLPSLSHSGVRHAPEVMAQAREALRSLGVLPDLPF